MAKVYFIKNGNKLDFVNDESIADIVVDCNKLEVLDGYSSIFNMFFKLENGKIIPDLERIKKSWIENKYKEIENLIYSKYPQSKQNSDLADKLYYENLLKAKGIKNLEADIVKRVEEYYKGKNLDEVISDVADENKESYLQLIKVGIRVTWVQMCKNELKKAIEEQREPEFPKYPL